MSASSNVSDSARKELVRPCTHVVYTCCLSFHTAPPHVVKLSWINPSVAMIMLAAVDSMYASTSA